MPETPEASRRRRAGWAMGVSAAVITVVAFVVTGPWAVLYLALLFTFVVFSVLALIVARQVVCRRSFRSEHAGA